MTNGRNSASGPASAASSSVLSASSVKGCPAGRNGPAWGWAERPADIIDLPCFKKAASHAACQITGASRGGPARRPGALVRLFHHRGRQDRELERAQAV